MLKANHVSQHYRLETDIARTYPSQIAAEKERIENLSRDIAACQPILDQGKDHFQITIAGEKLYRPQGGRCSADPGLYRCRADNAGSSHWRIWRFSIDGELQPVFSQI